MTSCELSSGSVFNHVVHMVVLHLFTNFCTNISMEILAFYEIEYGCRPPSWIYWGKSLDHQEGPFMVAITRNNFVMIALVVFKL